MADRHIPSYARLRYASKNDGFKSDRADFSTKKKRHGVLKTLGIIGTGIAALVGFRLCRR